MIKQHAGEVGLEAIKAHRDWEAYGMPVAGGVEDQPARWYQMVTIYGCEKGRLEKRDRDRDAVRARARHGHT